MRARSGVVSGADSLPRVTHPTLLVVRNRKQPFVPMADRMTIVQTQSEQVHMQVQTADSRHENSLVPPQLAAAAAVSAAWDVISKFRVWLPWETQAHRMKPRLIQRRWVQVREAMIGVSDVGSHGAYTVVYVHAPLLPHGPPSR